MQLSWLGRACKWKSAGTVLQGTARGHTDANPELCSSWFELIWPVTLSRSCFVLYKNTEEVKIAGKYSMNVSCAFCVPLNICNEFVSINYPPCFLPQWHRWEKITLLHVVVLMSHLITNVFRKPVRLTAHRDAFPLVACGAYNAHKWPRTKLSCWTFAILQVAPAWWQGCHSSTNVLNWAFFFFFLPPRWSLEFFPRVLFYRLKVEPFPVNNIIFFSFFVQDSTGQSPDPSRTNPSWSYVCSSANVPLQACRAPFLQARNSKLQAGRMLVE